MRTSVDYYAELLEAIVNELRKEELLRVLFRKPNGQRVSELHDAYLLTTAILRALTKDGDARPIKYLIQHQPWGKAEETIEYFTRQGY